MSGATYEHGFVRGLVAHAAGRPAVPALDPLAVRALSGVPAGAGLAYLSGWAAGWHSANLLDDTEGGE